jgi:hypothetical protein
VDDNITETEARLALDVVEHRRQQVAAEIDVPGWYWASMAGGWVVLGALGTWASPWVAAAATLVFGAVHAAVAPSVVSGRRGSSQLRVRRELVGRQVTVLVLGFLVAMTVVTVGVALVLDADGARHAGLLASVLVAGLVLVGGPGLVGWARRRAVRRSGA